MVSDYRVTFTTGLAPVSTGAERIMTVTDVILNVAITDGLGDQMPQATITLPLKRSTTEFGRIPYSELLSPGDHCLIEVLASYGRGEDWVTVLDGVVRTVSENESLSNGGREATTTIQVGSFADLLQEDTVAWWMYYGTLEGWARVRSYLTPDQLTAAPYRVAFDFLTRVGMSKSVYDHFGTLEDRISLDFDGMEARSPLELSLTMVEGSHWSIISQFLDAPLQELYATTTTPADFLGTLTRAAKAPNGVNGGATTVIWRKAPYVYADENGNAVADEWNALPVHDLHDVVPVVGSRGGSFSKAAIRNFTLVYPAYQFLDEQFAYAHGSAIANADSVAAFGYRPLKLRTHLLLNDSASNQDIIDLMKQLSFRAAGQWNQQQRLKTGVVSVPLAPWIRPGQRVRFDDPWTGAREYEYHVRARQMSLSPNGASMTLNLERGAPTPMYADPAWLMDGLRSVRVGAETYAAQFRRHDEPGLTE